MTKTKILAMYLPQYHEIPENSKFWGKGFTDWVSVKGAVPLCDNHDQPKIPLNDNYYDLSCKDSISWQIELAKTYGVFGWGIYHYWFSKDIVLLTKPVEIILENKDLDMPFFFAWDNANWKRSWSKLKGNAWSPSMDVGAKEFSTDSPLLIEYVLGEKEDWKIHFDYLLPYFSDDRYIKHDGKPIFIILNYSEKIKEMELYWNELAKENGFSGIEIIYKYDKYKVPEDEVAYTYEPAYSGWGGFHQRIIQKFRTQFGIKGLRLYSYDGTWKKIIRNAERNDKYHGAFVAYDDTPRRGNQGKIFLGSTPEKFEKYMRALLEISSKQNKEYVFLNAWNEWGEGAYLEPDKNNRYEYLYAIKRVSDNEGE